MAVDSSEVVQRLVAACPGFQPTWQAHVASQAGGEALNYVDVGVVAAWVADRVKAADLECFGELFEEVEALLAKGTPEARELLVVGFLEDLQNITTNRGIDPDLVLPFLGPISRKGWFDLIRQWHGTAGEGWPGKTSEG